MCVQPACKHRVRANGGLCSVSVEVWISKLSDVEDIRSLSMVCIEFRVILKNVCLQFDAVVRNVEIRRLATRMDVMVAPGWTVCSRVEGRELFEFDVLRDSPDLFEEHRLPLLRMACQTDAHTGGRFMDEDVKYDVSYDLVRMDADDEAFYAPDATMPVFFANPRVSTLEFLENHHDHPFVDPVMTAHAWEFHAEWRRKDVGYILGEPFVLEDKLVFVRRDAVLSLVLRTRYPDVIVRALGVVETPRHAFRTNAYAESCKWKSHVQFFQWRVYSTFAVSCVVHNTR